MSKIFKRPMFRRGGQVMDGVMSLAAPRSNYEKGGIGADITEKYPELGAGYQKFYDLYSDVAQQDMGQARSDILSNLLIRGGLGLVSGEGAGRGTLGEIATAFKGPTEQALGEMQTLKGTERQIKSAALGSAIEADLARQEREADLQEAIVSAQKGYESGTIESITKGIQDLYKAGIISQSQAEEASALAPKEAYGRLKAKDEGILFQGKAPLIKIKVDGQEVDTIDPNFLKVQPNGAIILHPRQRLFYKIVDGKPVRIDQRTFEEIE